MGMAQADEQTKQANGQNMYESKEKDINSDVLKARVDEVRTTVMTRFAEVALAMSTVPRYAHLSVGDLQAHALTPLVKERIAIAQSRPGEDGIPRTEGIAIWATVSDEVDTKIREQIKAGVFPTRLTADDWRSGDTIWLLDIIAPSKEATSKVLMNFHKIAGGKRAHMHPVLSKLVDGEVLEKMGRLSEGA